MTKNANNEMATTITTMLKQQIHCNHNDNIKSKIDKIYPKKSNTPHSLSSQQLQRNPPLFSTPPTAATGNGNYSSASSTPHYYTTVNSDQNSIIASNSPHNAYNSSYEKRTSNIVITGNKKPPSFASGNNVNRQNITNSITYNNGSTSNKPALIAINNDTRGSPNNSNSGYQGTRPHIINKRGDKQQTPLLSGPPSYTGNTISTHHTMSSDATTGKPPIRLNAAAASFRHKSNNSIEYRRSVSQRNSPGTNSSSNENSNNNSPNSISAASTTPITNCFVPTYIGNNSNSAGMHADQPQTTPTASLYIAARGTNHIPPPLPHGGTVVATTSGAATVLGGAMAHHQPLLGTYNPNAGSGMYVKYGQTIFAHPSVTLQNSRRSPSTDLRPPMAQMTGMYPTVNMMIPAHPRHAPSRHPNPNYKGTRPR
ncbi:protein encore-like [Teleopsis dalmanni]|uniref:protein encore-like n=1 Tax=Teleopsis dalmanni TaxID=139649 RepID=UPI0018CC9A76|nr:protein encore-like [Teleopsis dalmanni]